MSLESRHQDSAEAALDAGPIGEIAKTSVERAKVICAGEVQAVHQEEREMVCVAGLSIVGNWQVADFFIDHLIKGEVTSRKIRVRFFVPRDSMQGVYFDAIPKGKRCLLFLIPMAERKSTYVLVNRTGAMILLSPDRPIGIDRATQSEHLKSELLGAIAMKESWIAVAALRSSVQIDLTDVDVIRILKEVSKRDDKAVAGTALAMRISRMDKTSLAPARALVESGICPESQCKEIEAALRQLTASHFFTDLQKILQSPSEFLRRGASYALRHFDTDAVVPALISALGDADQEVRYNAVAGLAHLTSKTGEWFPAYSVFIKHQTFYISLWKNWWENQREK
jgi:hypothetical protein